LSLVVLVSEEQEGAVERPRGNILYWVNLGLVEIKFCTFCIMVF